jgi:hypothetical protein
MIKEKKMNNNKNSNEEVLNLKGKPFIILNVKSNSADLWKESLLTYIDSNKTPKRT